MQTAAGAGGGEIGLPLTLTPLAAAFRFVEPTWRNYIVYVEAEAKTGNPDARRYVAAWQALSKSERLCHAPEQICDLVNVKQDELLRWVAGQSWLSCSARSGMCLSFMRDKVLEKTAQFAMESSENARHTEIFLRAAGALPSSGGSRGSGGVNLSFLNMPVASSGSVALAGSKSESAPVDRSGLKDMDSEIVDLAAIMQTESSATNCKATEIEDEEEEDDEDDDDSDEDE